MGAPGYDSVDNTQRVKVVGSLPVTIASALEITNDAGNPIPVSQATLPLPISGVITSGTISVGNVPTVSAGTVSVGNIVTTTSSTLPLPVALSTNPTVIQATLPLPISGSVTSSGTVSVGNIPAVTVSGVVTNTQATLPLPVSLSSNPTVIQATLPLPISGTITSGTISIGNVPTVSAGTVSVGNSPVVSVSSGTVSVGNSHAVTVSSGTLSIGNDVNLTALASGGWSVFSALSLGSQATVSAAAGKFGGGMFLNLNATPVFIQVFDVAGSSAVTLGVNIPSYVLPLPSSATAANGAGFVLPLEVGIKHTAGIKIAATTNTNGASVVPTGLTGFVRYV